MKKTYFLPAAVMALGLATVFVSGCKKSTAGGAAAPTMVNAVEVVQQDLPWDIEYPAQVAGSLEIQIRAQVGGILEARLYNEGEYVEEGKPLFQIDDKQYKVALEKAQGALAQAQAEERRTQRTYARMKTLRADNAVIAAVVVIHFVRFPLPADNPVIKSCRGNLQVIGDRCGNNQLLPRVRRTDGRMINIRSHGIHRADNDFAAGGRFLHIRFYHGKVVIIQFARLYRRIEKFVFVCGKHVIIQAGVEPVFFIAAVNVVSEKGIEIVLLPGEFHPRFRRFALHDHGLRQRGIDLEPETPFRFVKAQEMIVRRTSVFDIEILVAVFDRRF